ncbi:unnamed protein product [Brassica napus]|uniref:(rape) hypothetical protein n=1 Tax=Brassica napus TaxID=3708 RepID=A0A816ZH62_BRANA|nr:unnamed protein product [Brassica napus]
MTNLNKCCSSHPFVQTNVCFTFTYSIKLSHLLNWVCLRL